MRQASVPFSLWIRQPQTLVALSALVLSLCGVFIAIYEASIMRSAQRASVWPYAEVASSITPGRVEIRVGNNGVGPARVVAAAIRYRGRTLGGWRELVLALDSEPVGIETYKSMIGGRVLPAGADAETIFRMVGETEASQVTAELGQAIWDGDLDVEVCYCSVYEECWTTTLQDIVRRSRPDAEATSVRPVDSCAGQPDSGV